MGDSVVYATGDESAGHKQRLSTDEGTITKVIQNKHGGNRVFVRKSDGMEKQYHSKHVTFFRKKDPPTQKLIAGPVCNPAVPFLIVPTVVSDDNSVAPDSPNAQRAVEIRGEPTEKSGMNAHEHAVFRIIAARGQVNKE